VTLHERVIRFAAEGSPGRNAVGVSRVVVGAGAIDALLDAFAATGARHAAVITDAHVVGSSGARVVTGFGARGIAVTSLIVPPGETAKSPAEYVRLCEALAVVPADRATQIVAVGGGVTGDLAGFVAATFLRGLGFWQIPTTLVGQVDSAVGGKTGINLDVGKNLVGAFWQPRFVACDPTTLATLPDREYRSGLAEVVKYGVILDRDLFQWLESRVDQILARDPAAVAQMVGRCVDLKLDIVAEDEFERSGRRAILNYGHTVGHALEMLAGYGRLLHGEAVAIGMTAAARIAIATGRLGVEQARRQAALLARFGLPLVVPDDLRRIGVDDVCSAMRRDKKTLHGTIRFILPTAIGRVEITDDVDEGVVRAVLDDLLTGG